MLIDDQAPNCIAFYDRILKLERLKYSDNEFVEVGAESEYEIMETTQVEEIETDEGNNDGDVEGGNEDQDGFVVFEEFAELQDFFTLDRSCAAF